MVFAPVRAPFNCSNWLVQYFDLRDIVSPIVIYLITWNQSFSWVVKLLGFGLSKFAEIPKQIVAGCICNRSDTVEIWVQLSFKIVIWWLLQLDVLPSIASDQIWTSLSAIQDEMIQFWMHGFPTNGCFTTWGSLNRTGVLQVILPFGGIGQHMMPSWYTVWS